MAAREKDARRPDAAVGQGGPRAPGATAHAAARAPALRAAIRVALAAAAALVPTAGIVRAQPSELPLAHWQHTKWTGRAGPPVPGPFAMVRSPDGYLWLSAFNRLLRFDGVRFTVLDSTATPALRPRENGTFDPILVDRHGVLWIAAPGDGLVAYQNGRFREAVAPRGASLYGEDAHGLIWMRGGRPQRFESGRLSPLPLPAALAKTDLWAVRADTGGGMWIGTRTQGIWRVSRTGSARQYGAGEIRPLLVSRAGTLWAVGQGVSGTARLEGGRWHPLRLPNDSGIPFTRFASEDREGAIWFQTNADGVLRYVDGTVEAFTERHGLSDDRVRDVEVDPSGVVWVSTDAGLDRLRPAPFAPLDPTGLVPGGIGYDFVPDRGGGFWVTAREGTNVYLLEGGLLGDGARPLTARTFRFGDAASVNLLAPSASGGVWVKPFGGDLLRLGRDGVRRRVAGEGALAKRRVNGGIATADGTLWLELNPGGFGRLRDGQYRQAPVAGLDTSHADAYVEDGRGRLWLSWGDQPNLAVLEGDSLLANVRVPVKPPIASLAREHGDTLWAVSEETLLRIVGDRAVEVRVPSLRRVLAPRVSIAVAQGSLWVSSTTGIASLPLVALHRAADGHPVEITPRLFDELDGLPAARATQMEWQSVLAGPDGRVWLKTAAGVAVTSPPRRATARPSPRVMLEEVTLDGAPMADDLRIPVRPGRLELHFTVTGTELPERARLQYRLDGIDRGWVDATLSRVASYGKLPPGSYRFRVRAWDGNGVRIPGEADRRFRVPPAWNQTWWYFASIAAVIAATAAAGAVGWQRRRGRREAERAQARFEAILGERARVARELHDTLLSDMAGVAMQLSAGARRADASGAANATIVELLSGLSRQVQRTLVDARRAVTAMRSASDAPTPLVDRIADAARRTFDASGIAAHVEHTGSPRPLAPTVEAEIVVIATEAMTNARRHAQCRRVAVTCRYTPRALEMRVRDDGRGFDPSGTTPAGHWGVIGMRERAASMDATLTIASAPGAGAEVTLVVPARG